MTGGNRMADEGSPSATVEKVMSTTRAEFERGLERLTGAPPRPNGHGGYVLGDMGTGVQTIGCAFEPLADAVLGGLMRLPRVRVRLDLAALPVDTRRDFVARFDRTFQRGGG